MKIENVYFANQIVNNTLFLTLDTCLPVGRLQTLAHFKY
jgi:hypothetical protein